MFKWQKNVERISQSWKKRGIIHIQSENMWFSWKRKLHFIFIYVCKKADDNEFIESEDREGDEWIGKNHWEN